jgi:hypothetical protein
MSHDSVKVGLVEHVPSTFVGLQASRNQNIVILKSYSLSRFPFPLLLDEFSVTLWDRYMVHTVGVVLGSKDTNQFHASKLLYSAVCFHLRLPSVCCLFGICISNPMLMRYPFHPHGYTCIANTSFMYAILSTGF